MPKDEPNPTREKALNFVNSAEIGRIVMAQLEHGDNAAEHECHVLKLWNWQIPLVLEYAREVVSKCNPYQLLGDKIFETYTT